MPGVITHLQVIKEPVEDATGMVVVNILHIASRWVGIVPGMIGCGCACNPGEESVGFHKKTGFAKRGAELREESSNYGIDVDYFKFGSNVDVAYTLRLGRFL